MSTLPTSIPRRDSKPWIPLSSKTSVKENSRFEGGIGDNKCIDEPGNLSVDASDGTSVDMRSGASMMGMCGTDWATGVSGHESSSKSVSKVGKANDMFGKNEEDQYDMLEKS